MLHVGSGIIPRLWKTIRWNWDSGGRELKSEGDREEKYSEVKQQKVNLELQLSWDGREI